VGGLGAVNVVSLAAIQVPEPLTLIPLSSLADNHGVGNMVETAWQEERDFRSHPTFSFMAVSPAHLF